MAGSGLTHERPLRLVLFGDGAWAADSLRLLHGGPHPVAAVVLRARPSDDTLGAMCTRLGVPVLQPENAAAPAFIAELQALEPDLGLSISYNQILRRCALDRCALGVVNFHAGLLPRYRGRNVINWAIINGEREIGLTAHYVDEGIDTGDIIAQRRLPIAWTDTYGDVLTGVVAALPDLVVDTVTAIAAGSATRCPQAHDQATYFGGREVGDEWLDWSDTSVNLHNKVRAITHPGPGARTLFGDRELIVWRAYCDPAWPRYLATPGQVVGRRPGADGGVIVKTGDSTLLVQLTQVPGDAPAVPAWRIGTRLGVNAGAALHTLLARRGAADTRSS